MNILKFICHNAFSGDKDSKFQPERKWSERKNIGLTPASLKQIANYHNRQNFSIFRFPR